MSEATPLLLAQTAAYTNEILQGSPNQTHDNGKKAKLGTFEGVFLPTTLNVLSILMFLRFGFIIGQMGIMGSLLLLAMSFVIDILTVCSVSAISTNGTVRGGGAYYMISRSLGPEFGGAIGIIFFIGQILNSALNVVGFIEPLLVNFGKVQGDVLPLLPVSYWWQVIYSTILLMLCTSVALVGASLVSKTAFWLFILLTTSTLLIPLSALIVRPGNPLSPPYDDLWYSGISWKTIQENLWPNFTSGAAGSLLPPGEPETFKNLFGIFFPATAGIFAGASMSGELKNPSRSIPRGTLFALTLSFFLYFLVIIALGASVPRELFHKDIKIIQTVNINGLIIIIGEVSTSLFSVIMGIVGGATVLNAIAVDRIIPGLSCFSTARKLPKEKKRAQSYAILLTWAIAQVFLFSDINQIATFITMAFLMTFLVTNLACFLLRVGSAPNFRPSFKYFSTKTAFSGGLVSVLAMYLVDGVSATSVIVFLIFLIMIIHYTTPPLNFGDISQLLIYHQVRKYLLRLKLNMSVKYWRPQILLLCDNPRTSWNLIAFCNHLKKGGLYILGHVVLMSDDSAGQSDVNSEFNVSSYKEIRKQKNAWTKLRDMAKIKAFVQIAIGPSLPWGVRNVFLGSGLGGMRPNITVLGFYDSQKHGVELPLKQEQRSMSTLHLPTDECRKERKVSVNQWVQIVEDLVIMQATVAVAGNFSRMEVPILLGSRWTRKFKSDAERKYIDLYPIQMSSICLMDDGKSVMSTNFDTYTLILQLGAILSTVDEWEKNNYHLRIIVFVESANEVEDELTRLKDLLVSLRIDAETVVKCFEDGFLHSYNFMVKGYTVSPTTQEEFNHMNHVLHSDQWWINLCDARESLRQIQKQKLQRRRSDKKMKSIDIKDERKYDPVLFNLSKSNSSPITGPSLKNNRRYTLSNLHGQGLSLSFNMKAQGGESFYAYESEDSSDSELEGSVHSSVGDGTGKQRTPEISSPEQRPSEVSSPLGKNPLKMPNPPASSANQQRHPQRDHGNKPGNALMAKYTTSLGAMSSDQLSVKSSMSNLRPNFLSVKIPQSRVRDEEDEEPLAPQDEDDEHDETNKPLIQFIEDEQDKAKSFLKNPTEKRLAAKVQTPRSESSLSIAQRPSMKRAPSIIANNDIKEHIKSPKFVTGDDDDEDIHDESLNHLTDTTDSDSAPMAKKLTLRQLMEELKSLTFNDLPAKGQHIILNELMRQISGDGKTAVIFSTLPAPVIGTHLDDSASLDYTNSLAIWLDNLPPTLLLNSQTVTVTTNL